ncbi:MAG: hypothetical protein KGL46_04725 [Hyphomicrobiales bacterium]|nr:hypothetical protein [Hyphomicrobiales bacterium]
MTHFTFAAPLVHIWKLYNKKVHTSQYKVIYLNKPAAELTTTGALMPLEKPSRFTRGTIVLIMIVQVMLGLVFVITPHSFPSMMGLPPAPGWTDWIFAQFGARALGFAYGMFVALRDLRRHAHWLTAMIIVQVIDWIGTALALYAGSVNLAQVSTAPFLPILFIIVLAQELARQRKTGPAKSQSRGFP